MLATFVFLSANGDLQVLIEDMQCYKQIDRKSPHLHHNHAGDLYEHSLWVEQVIAEWADEKHPEHFWCEGLSNRDLYLTALAGFLHDVAKAGDKEREGYECKCSQDQELIVEYEGYAHHPRIGFEQLFYDHAQPYRLLTTNEPFDFKKLFENLSVTAEERALIAILVGIHWDFGITVKNPGDKEGHRMFIEKLNGLVQETGYNKGQLNERLVRMACLIGAADVKGAKPTTGTKTLFFPMAIKRDRVYATQYNLYEDYAFNEAGKQSRGNILAYFEKHWEVRA